MTSDQDADRPIALPDPPPAPAPDDGEDVRALVGQPAKVMRIGTMVKQLLDEVRAAPLDDAARTRLAEIHERSLAELEDGLSPDLAAELHRLTLPLGDETPTDAELRIAQAQLVGWLEGLFHGIQTALVAQQMAAQSQLVQMRRGLPPGGIPGLAAGPDGTVEDDPRHAPGQYL
ncbi:MAG: bacterial proteasome activator family protein [Actinobacteria bacterium]|nr:bacterial proteasome activator family protein [Actinomycetota bacterium]